VARDEENRSGHRRREGLDEKRRAVRVAPLQVVKEENQPATPGQAIEQLSKCVDALLPESVEIRGVESLGPFSGQRHRQHLVEHGKQPGQGRRLAWQDGRGFVDRQLLKVTREVIDKPVQRLVGNRLRFVAATRQGQVRIVMAPLDLAQELTHQRRLAGSGSATHLYDDDAVTGELERLLQGTKLPIASDEASHGTVRAGPLWERGRRQAVEDLWRLRPQRRIDLEQVPAETVEIIRKSGVELPWKRGRLDAFPHHDVTRGTRERKLAGHRLVQHDAQAVTIAGLGELAVEDLRSRIVGGPQEQQIPLTPR
jgi:hypothetical protein